MDASMRMPMNSAGHFNRCRLGWPLPVGVVICLWSGRSGQAVTGCHAGELHLDFLARGCRGR